jgi:predicted HicB family RNase H-like nuclease
MPNDHYTYRVTWSPDDQEFVGTCAEFPSLSWLEADDIDALRGIKKLVAEVAEDMRANGEAVPEPLADRKYSGRFVVRTTSQVHRRLAVEAAEAKVSLNRYINAKLVNA